MHNGALRDINLLLVPVPLLFPPTSKGSISYPDPNLFVGYGSRHELITLGPGFGCEFDRYLIITENTGSHQKIKESHTVKDWC